MIVSIKLSIPAKDRHEVEYHMSKLLDMARLDYPGHACIYSRGLQGTVKTKNKKQPQRDTVPENGQLFS